MSEISASPEPSGAADARRGGVLLRFDDSLAFVSADVARKVAPLAALTAVPGTRPPVAGMALVDGAVVTVLQLGNGVQRRSSYEPGADWPLPGADRAVLCQVGGFDVAIAGGVVLATGVFDAAPGGEGVLWRGEVVPAIDVRAIYAQAEAAMWAERAVTTGPPARAELSELDEGRQALLPGLPDDRGGAG